MPINQIIIIMLVLVLLAVGFVVYFVTQQMKVLKESMEKGENGKLLMEWMRDLKKDVNETINKNSETIEKQLKDQRDSMLKQTQVLGDRFDTAAKVIGGVQKHLGEMGELGKDMKDLSNILKSPKLRGNLGEKFLYEILENFLPQSLFKTQYKFRDGAICDAVIVTDRGLIPVDSKFPMENFEAMFKADSDSAREKFQKEFVKDVKKRVDEIASKYILPEEGTTDQAIMYIPSESVYYEAIVRTSGIEEYAQRKGVLITSPNTFTSFVGIIMIGYRQNELAENATEILKALSGIQMEADKFGGELEVLDGHITRTTKSMDNVKSKYGKLIGKITAVQALGSGLDESPSRELSDGSQDSLL